MTNLNEMGKEKTSQYVAAQEALVVTDAEIKEFHDFTKCEYPGDPGVSLSSWTMMIAARQKKDRGALSAGIVLLFILMVLDILVRVIW